MIRRLALIASALLIICMPAAHAGAGRALSLNAAAAAIKSGSGAQAEGLCGITRLTGYIADPTTNDVILIGKVDPALPAMHFADLVVALRNAWMVYAHTEGRVRYYTPPGCSIDPNPEVLRELQRIHEADISDPVKKATYIERWREVGRRPQKVRVMGVPFDCRFAKVMVDADYYMKRLVNGSVKLEIPGFDSLSALNAAQVRAALVAGEQDKLASHTMSRFWFSPAEATYSQEDGATILESCRVQLLTEEEFLTENGISGMGRPNELAKQFAQGFTRHYSQIADARPVYKELEALFRFAGLTRIMRESGVHLRSLDYLLRNCPVARVPVSREVLGLTTTNELTVEKETPDGRSVLTMMMPTCGGVSMDIRPKRVRVAKAAPAPKPATTQAKSPSSRAGKRAPAAVTRSPKAAKPTTLRQTVLAARKSQQSLSWDFPAAGSNP